MGKENKKAHSSQLKAKLEIRGWGSEIREASMRGGLFLFKVKIVPVVEAMKILSGCPPFSDYPAQDGFFRHIIDFLDDFGCRCRSSPEDGGRRS